MFLHNFKYTLKTLFKNKALIFWTFIFPIILATFYNMAFSNIEKSEHFNTIDIAIVDDIVFKNNIFYKEVFDELSNSKEKIVNVIYCDIDTCETLLNDKKIIGYLKIENDTTNIVVSKNGPNETIFRLIVDEINNEKKIYDISNEYSIDYTKINNYVKLNDITSPNISYTLIEFYNLIAMAALYGGIISISVINKRLANMDNVGKRVSLAPIKKKNLLFGSLLASLIVELIGLILLLLYMIIVLKINMGCNILLVILLVIASVLSGLSFGLFIGVILKVNEDVKVGILISITMFMCFLSGMTGMVMKYIIDTNIPILNIINPASMITDGFYSLYYYSNLNKYWFDILSLIIFTALMIFISFMSLRRQKYDSI